MLLVHIQFVALEMLIGIQHARAACVKALSRTRVQINLMEDVKYAFNAFKYSGW